MFGQWSDLGDNNNRGAEGGLARLNISVASYDRRGHLKGFEAAAPASMFQLCNGSYDTLNAAFNFGVRYEKSCQISKHSFLKWARKTEDQTFYDLFIPFETGDMSQKRLRKQENAGTKSGNPGSSGRQASGGSAGLATSSIFFCFL